MQTNKMLFSYQLIIATIAWYHNSHTIAENFSSMLCYSNIIVRTLVSVALLNGQEQLYTYLKIFLSLLIKKSWKMKFLINWITIKIRIIYSLTPSDECWSKVGLPTRWSWTTNPSTSCKCRPLVYKARVNVVHRLQRVIAGQVDLLLCSFMCVFILWYADLCEIISKALLFNNGFTYILLIAFVFILR